MIAEFILFVFSIILFVLYYYSVDKRHNLKSKYLNLKFDYSSLKVDKRRLERKVGRLEEKKDDYQDKFNKYYDEWQEYRKKNRDLKDELHKLKVEPADLQVKTKDNDYITVYNVIEDYIEYCSVGEKHIFVHNDDKNNTVVREEMIIAITEID